MAKITYPKKIAPIETLNPMLREVSHEVTREMINDKHFQEFLDDMIDYVYGRKRSKNNAETGKPNVIGLAAVQVGIKLRVCVVDMALNMSGKIGEKYHDMRIIINPKIVNVSKEKDSDLESCVSCPEMWGTVARPRQVTVDCLDRWGNKFRIEGRDWVAKLFHHEIDHMDGNLFIDRLPENKIHWVKDGAELKHYRNDENWEKIVPKDMYGEKKFVRD